MRIDNMILRSGKVASKGYPADDSSYYLKTVEFRHNHLNHLSIRAADVV